MMADELIARARAVYHSLKHEARERYPVGHSYALASGKIVASDSAEQGVRQQVHSLGLSEKEVMVEQVLADVVECNVYLGWTLFSAMAERLIRVMTPENVRYIDPPLAGASG